MSCLAQTWVSLRDGFAMFIAPDRYPFQRCSEGRNIEVKGIIRGSFRPSEQRRVFVVSGCYKHRTTSRGEPKSALTSERRDPWLRKWFLC